MEKINMLRQQLELIEAIKNNDQRVLKSLYKDNYRKIESYIVYNNGSEEAAKDIYQEAFLVVYSHIQENRFKPHNETAIQGYLYQIARNKWTDYLRSNQYKKTLPLKPEMVEDRSTDYEMEADSQEMDALRVQTAEAFQQLDSECKKLLEVFYFDKASLHEIATQFGIGEASARNKKYRCLQKLKDFISPKP